MALIEEKKAFMTGNEVVAWAAVAARADIMYGYPITPQNEIMHYWTRLAPKYEKKFMQTEDELSAGFTALGGVMAGKRAFTATAGPGNVLMQEPIAMAEMMRIPSVMIIQQRGGPSTATVIYAQQEVTLTTRGGNGEGMRVVYSTSTHQELYDYTIKAFNTAWKYRFPTFVLGDGYQAKSRETVFLYDPESRGTVMEKTVPFIGQAGEIGKDREAQHYRNTFNIEEELEEVIFAHVEDYERMKPEVIEYEEQYLDTECDLLLVAHGIVARAAKSAVEALQKKGLKVGFFRPITLRPFPVQEMYRAAMKAKKILVAESAYGQLALLVKEALYGLPDAPLFLEFFRPGVGITDQELLEQCEKGLRGGKNHG